MTIDNIGGRLAAIVCATALGVGGTSLLFGDVIAGAADFTQKHLQTICIVVATTGAWLAVTIAAKKRAPIAFIGWLVLSLFGTGVICWYSLGRQTEGQLMSADSHDKAAEERGRLKAKLVDEEKARTAKRNDADAVCKKYGPEHRRCLGARAVEAVYADSLAGIEARLKSQQVKPVDASAEAFGNLVAALGGNRDKAKALALLFMPYLITGLFELGFTWSLHDAFRPGNVRKANIAPLTELLTVRQQLATPDSPAVLPKNSSGATDGQRDGGARTVRPQPDSPLPAGRWSEAQTLAYVRAELAAGRTVPMQQVLVGLSGVRKQRISDWMSEWEADQRIPMRTQAGRCKVLVAAN
jgi:hypothetical protein